MEPVADLAGVAEERGRVGKLGPEGLDQPFGPRRASLSSALPQRAPARAFATLRDFRQRSEELLESRSGIGHDPDGHRVVHADLIGVEVDQLRDAVHVRAIDDGR